jgi:predicted RNA binding protein YcfA (HicA-like mRNA interferase family)
VLPARKVLKALYKAGFEIVGRKGSHIRLKKKTATEVRIVVVPDHPEIQIGTLRSILRQAGISREEFLELL